jgi:hypothetical protein
VDAVLAFAPDCASAPIREGSQPSTHPVVEAGQPHVITRVTSVRAGNDMPGRARFTDALAGHVVLMVRTHDEHAHSDDFQF